MSLRIVLVVLRRRPVKGIGRVRLAVGWVISLTPMRLLPRRQLRGQRIVLVLVIFKIERHYMYPTTLWSTVPVTLDTLDNPITRRRVIHHPHRRR